MSMEVCGKQRLCVPYGRSWGKLGKRSLSLGFTPCRYRYCHAYCERFYTFEFFNSLYRYIRTTHHTSLASLSRWFRVLIKIRLSTCRPWMVYKMQILTGRVARGGWADCIISSQSFLISRQILVTDFKFWTCTWMDKREFYSCFRS